MTLTKKELVLCIMSLSTQIAEIEDKVNALRRKMKRKNFPEEYLAEEISVLLQTRTELIKLSNTMKICFKSNCDFKEN